MNVYLLNIYTHHHNSLCEFVYNISKITVHIL